MRGPGDGRWRPPGRLPPYAWMARCATMALRASAEGAGVADPVTQPDPQLHSPSSPPRPPLPPSLTERRHAATQLDIAAPRPHSSPSTGPRPPPPRPSPAAPASRCAPSTATSAPSRRPSARCSRPVPTLAGPDRNRGAWPGGPQPGKSRAGSARDARRARGRTAAGPGVCCARPARPGAAHRLAPRPPGLRGATAPGLRPARGPSADPLEVRLAAAAATDAIRVALESWSATDAPATGPGSPAELAVRCLRELTGAMRLLGR